MLLILTSFLLSFIIYLVIDTLRRWNESAKKLYLELDSVSYAECYLECVNVDIQETWTSVPTFIKVYIIGIVETIYIAYSKRGFLRGSITQADNEKHTDEIVEQCSGKGNHTTPPIAVVTGGDSGIGLEITKGLLVAGYHVIIGTHSEENCRETINMLHKSTGTNNASCIPLDLSSFKSVKDFVKQVQSKISNKDIDLLINNAGVMNVPFRKTEDGYESQCQINFLSPMLLTQLLLPHINSECGRVLFASSSTMYTMNDLDVRTPTQEYKLNGLDHYAYSKACVAQLVQHLAKTSSVKIYSYHPGTVRTKLFSTTTVFNLPLVSRIFEIIMYSPKEGSQTPLYLSLNKHLEGSGSYWANERKQKLPSVVVNGTKDNIDGLWSDTIEKIGLKNKT